MTFTPRLPVRDNSQHKHEADTGTVSAGSIMYLTESGTVAKVTASGQTPYGILSHNVKASLAGLPAGYEFPGEIGSADVRLGDPCQVFQDGGTFECDLYDYVGSGGLPAGTKLYARVLDSATNGQLTNDTSNVADADGAALAVALVQEPLTHDEAAAGKALQFKLLI
jgi:hypothetical protein